MLSQKGVLSECNPGGGQGGLQNSHQPRAHLTSASGLSLAKQTSFHAQIEFVFLSSCMLKLPGSPASTFRYCAPRQATLRTVKMSNNRRPAPCEGPDQGVFDEDEIEEEIWKSAGDVWRATKKRYEKLPRQRRRRLWKHECHRLTHIVSQGGFRRFLGSFHRVWRSNSQSSQARHGGLALLR